MKKKILTLVLTVTLLTGLYGCSTADSKGTADTAKETATLSDGSSAADEAEGAQKDTDTETSEEGVQDAAAAESTDYTTGSPWIDSNIESNVESAGEADLKDHFDLAVNGEWVKSHQIRSGESYLDFAGTFSDTLNERLLRIVEDDSDTEDHNAKLVSTLYREFMDWDARDAAGTEPLMPYLQEIQDIQNYEDLGAFTTKSDFTFAGVLSLWMESNPSDATQHILGVSRMSFFLDDAADYEDLENMSDYTRLIYESEKEKAEIVLTQCGYTKEEADQIYEGAIQFEKTAAQWCYNSEEINLTDTREILNAQVYKPEDLEQYRWYALLKDLAANEDIREIPAVWLCEKKDYFEHLDEFSPMKIWNSSRIIC